jgi:hypothetical protein
MVETHSPRPALLVADDDAYDLAKIERELSARYGKGYRLVCGASAEVGIEKRSSGARSRARTWPSCSPTSEWT